MIDLPRTEPERTARARLNDQLMVSVKNQARYCRTRAAMTKDPVQKAAWLKKAKAHEAKLTKLA